MCVDKLTSLPWSNSHEECKRRFPLWSDRGVGGVAFLVARAVGVPDAALAAVVLVAVLAVVVGGDLVVAFAVAKHDHMFLRNGAPLAGGRRGDAWAQCRPMCGDNPLLTR